MLLLEYSVHSTWSDWSYFTECSVLLDLVYLRPVSAVPELSFLAVCMFPDVKAYVVFAFVACGDPVIVSELYLYDVPSLRIRGVDGVPNEEEFVS